MILHFDQSLAVFVEHIQSALCTSSTIVIILRDLYGRLSCHLLINDESQQVANQIEENFKADEAGLGMYYAQPLVMTHKADDRLWERMQLLAQPLPASLPKEPRIKIIERLLEGKSWLSSTQSPPPPPPPYLITFYSFKGGVGRTTAAAMSALKIARQGYRVCMIDLDLEAPGLSSMALSAEESTKDRLGVIDYLLERRLAKEKLILDDYLVGLNDQLIEKEGGGLWLMPAGRVDENYLVKLGRLDFQGMSGEDFTHSALRQLFLELQEHGKFDYYVVDSRTGVTDIGGLALNGLAHLNVMLFGIGSQNIQGMNFVLQHLRPMLEEQLVIPNGLANRLMIVFSPVPVGNSQQTDREMESRLCQITTDALTKQLNHNNKALIKPLIIPYLSRLPIQEDLAGVDYVQRKDANPPPFDQLANSILELTSLQG